MFGNPIDFISFFIFACVLAWALPHRLWTARFCAFVALLSLECAYLWWRLSWMPEFKPAWKFYWPWLFFSSELLAMIYFNWSLFAVVNCCNHSDEARRLRDAFMRKHAASNDAPPVDILIATYNESHQVLQNTFEAARKLCEKANYPGRVRVFVADQGGTEEEIKTNKKLSESKRKDMLTRYEFILRSCNDPNFYHSLCTKEHEQTTKKYKKLANQQNAFEQMENVEPGPPGEFILQLDADHCPESSLLQLTVPILVQHKDIGLVQVPQCFSNADPIAHNLGIDKLIPEDQHFFMTYVQAGRDVWSNAFCVGTGCVVRRRALLEVDGGYIPERERRTSICEDLEISYRLKQGGYRTFYLNYEEGSKTRPLSRGNTPETMAEFIKQRVRWCQGTLQQLWLKTGPVRGSHGPLSTLFYLDTVAYWFTFFFLFLLLIAPIVFWGFGASAIPCPAHEAAMVLIPRLIVRETIVYWISRKKASPLLTLISRAIVTIPICWTILWSLPWPFGVDFKVTDKGSNEKESVYISLEGWKFWWCLVIPFLVIPCLSVSLMVVDPMSVNALALETGSLWLQRVWTIVVTLICLLCAVIFIEHPRNTSASEDARVDAFYTRQYLVIITRVVCSMVTNPLRFFVDSTRVAKPTQVVRHKLE